MVLWSLLSCWGGGGGGMVPIPKFGRLTFSDAKKKKKKKKEEEKKEGPRPE